MAKISAMLGVFFNFLLSGLAVLFGTWQWQRPQWLGIAAGWIFCGFRHVRSHLRAYAVGIAAVLLAGGGGWYAYQWWQSRPQPLRADFTVQAPERTEIENNGKPKPLLVAFNASVAPLTEVGKDVRQGITVNPAVAGHWHWVSDRLLELRPDKDWPVGQTYQVEIGEGLIAGQILLARQAFEFATAPFVAQLQKAEFYRDPTDPALKKAVIAVHFSHPVDAQSFEKHLALTLQNVAGEDQEPKPVKATVIYDKLGLNAYVHSQPLPIPRFEQRVNFSLAAGVKAASSNGSEAASADALQTTVNVPGLYAGNMVDAVSLEVTQNDQTQRQDQLLLLATSVPVHEHEVAKALQVWLLPEHHPGTPEGERDGPYAWNVDEATPDILKLAGRVELQALPAEREVGETHAFRLQADVGRRLLVKIGKGMKSFGGYVLPEAFYRIVEVPEFPKELRIMGEGSLLALSGEKKIALMARDLPGVKVEIGRVLPSQLQHLVSQNSGDFSHPEFYGRFGRDNLIERFELALPLPETVHGRPYYQPVELGQYLVNAEGQEKRGVFLLTATPYDPAKQKAKREGSENQGSNAGTDSNEEAEGASGSEEESADYSGIEDKRLILLTDLGLIVKTELDGSQLVFVQSIKTGQPVAGAEVEVTGKNGLAVANGKTDAGGKVRFAKLGKLERERKPVMYLAKHRGDLSFLPLGESQHELDFSRFNIGGIENTLDARQLSAYLFSDRGLYRPGDEFHIGIIVKAEHWDIPLAGIPLEAEVLDARGLAVKREKLNLGAGGFSELSYQTLESSPTGVYTVNLYTAKDGKPGQQLGAATVKVEEFQPDRMKAVARFSQPASDGWLHPKDLQAVVNVQNLYGAPAEARQVEAELSLSPALPAFKAFPDYQFYDPHYAEQSYDETLNAAQTDSEGNARFALGLEKYARATYRLHFVAQAFEAQGGRSVAAEADTLVSDLPYLLGYKADGALDFVARDAKRQVQLLAVGPAMRAVAAENLQLQWVERKVLSVLARQDDGTYRYESRPKEVPLKTTPLALPAEGAPLPLDSGAPGNYSYIVRNADGLQLSRIDYSVAGQGNVSRSLDRNAELQLTLDKQSYAPGEKIAVNIRAPYTGAGLITIERDKVYASQWFRADTQASVQYIEVPPGLEGNGYVNVQYIRDPGSDEIYMSPLSYGVVPFKVSLAARTQNLGLDVSELIKPGDTLTMKLRSDAPTRAVLFAVDEGILQVARYKNPEPLGYFFRKRQLQVDSAQILDLILPEFNKLMSAAPGGDGDEGAASLLNPFKRKRDKPAVYWSGIVDVDGEREFSYQVPDTFNGTLRVLAVAVNDLRIAGIMRKTQVRGDLIVSPNAPMMAAPGDEFTVSVAVANNVAGSGKDAPVQVELAVPPQLQVLDGAQKTVAIAEKHEGAVSFRLKVRDGNAAVLGNADLAFSAGAGGKWARLKTGLSIRPATPKVATMQFGHFQGKLDIAIPRQLYPEYRKLSAGLSPLPLVALPGLGEYLDNFEHYCTEQLVSKAMPGLVLGKRPEFAISQTPGFNADSFANLVAVLRTRQNAEGGFGLWTASPQAHEFASTYALHMLLEAQTHGQTVPGDLLQKSLAYAQTLAASPADTLPELRVRAYAAYLLTRQGTVTAAMLASIREALRANYRQEQWQDDLAAVYLAASYQLLQQDDVAEELIDPAAGKLENFGDNYGDETYYDPLVRGAQTLYVLARHFPERLKDVPPGYFVALGKALQENRYNTLSSAYVLLAFDAYLQAVPASTAAQLAISALDAAGQAQALPLPANFAPRTAFPETARSLRFQGPAGMPLFYAVMQSGFDRDLPDSEQRDGLEIIRDYVDDNGKALSQIKLGDEVTVRLRVRAIDRDSIGNVAIQDLLPGGFEPVLQDQPAEVAADDSSEEESGNATLSPWADRLGIGGNWRPEYADVREDRVLLYGTVSRNMAEYHYKIKAASAGVFNVPAIHAQALYVPTLRAHSRAGQVRVEAEGGTDGGRK